MDRQRCLSFGLSAALVFASLMAEAAPATAPLPNAAPPAPAAGSPSPPSPAVNPAAPPPATTGQPAPLTAPPAASAPRRPRSYAACNRIAQQRRLRGADRRHYVTRCQLGYGRALFRRRAAEQQQ